MASNLMVSGARCLVLGGKGFLGSHLVDALLQQGYRVRSFDRAKTVSGPKQTSTASGIELVEGNFGNDSDLAAAVAGCDVCFHLISTTLPKSSNTDPVFDIETNLVGTIRLLNHAVRSGLRKLVFVSSGGTVYGRTQALPLDENHPTNPMSSYGIVKLSIEKYLELYRLLHGLEYSVVRLSNPYGERQRTDASQGAVAVFLGKVLKGEPLEIWGDGSVVRDYIYVSDVTRALVAAAGYSGEDRVLNIGSGQGTSLNELIAAISRATGKEVVRTYLPARSFDVPASVLCTERARRALAWRPEVPLLEGIARTAGWIGSQLNQP